MEAASWDMVRTPLQLIRDCWTAAGHAGRRLVWLLPIAFLAGCGKEEIEVYTVPKESTQRTSHTHGGEPERPSIRWTVPQHWEQKAATGMRVGSFLVTGPEGRQVDVSVVPLAGEVGTELDNLNRWRGQVGLAPVTDAELPALSQPVQIGPAQGKLYEMVSDGLQLDGKHKARLVVAAVTHEGMSWYFRMFGEDALVDREKAAFLEFLKSVSFVEPSQPAPSAGTASATAPRSSGQPEWRLPKNWNPTPPGPMLLAKFNISQDGANAEVTVSRFPGDVGGVLANVNRWRGQIGLEPVAESELGGMVASLDLPGQTAMLVDMKGSQSRRLIAAIVPRGGNTWFYKLMGDEKAVEAQKNAFIEFVQSVKYSDA